jgi:hypothetical protein
MQIPSFSDFKTELLLLFAPNSIIPFPVKEEGNFGIASPPPPVG